MHLCKDGSFLSFVDFFFLLLLQNKNNNHLLIIIGNVNAIAWNDKTMYIMLTKGS
jgi:hypothetical protein